MKNFGNRIGRIEDPDLLRGRAKFVDDLKFENMAHAAFVRSSHGHASVRGIDKSAALAIEGVYAICAFLPAIGLLAAFLPNIDRRQTVTA